MGWKVVFIKILTIQIFFTIIFAYKYDIVIRDEEVFSPCEFPSSHYIDEYLDMSNMHYNYLENGSVHFHGDCTLIKEVGTENIEMMIELYKKSRDNWVSTIYNLKRPDVCTAMFDSTELWFSYMKDIPAEDRSCPLYKGRKFIYNGTTAIDLELPDPRMAGEYKIQITCNIKSINEVVCANVMVELYRT